MIEKRAFANGIESRALYAPCLRYRYGLERRWSDGPAVLWVMLNPSTASEVANDPTIERCQRRSTALGFGTMRIANLFAWRATRPADLSRAKAPVGGENDAILRAWAKEADIVVAGWGVHGALKQRGPVVARWLPGDVRHLGLTKTGHPRHPLYVAYSVSPRPWPPDSRYAASPD